MAEASTSTSTATATLFLTPAQRYAVGALFAIALHQSQIHQSQPLGLPPAVVAADDDSASQERISRCSGGNSSSDSVSEDPELWVHQNSGLLRPVFSFLEINSSAWSELEEIAGSSPTNNHVGAFLRVLAEDSGGTSSEGLDHGISLSKAVITMIFSFENPASSKTKKKKHHEYEHECREKLSSDKVQSSLEEAGFGPENTGYDR